MSDELLRVVALASCDIPLDGGGLACLRRGSCIVEGADKTGRCLTRARRALEACHHAALVEALEAVRQYINRLIVLEEGGNPKRSVLAQIDAALSLAKPTGGTQ